MGGFSLNKTIVKSVEAYDFDNNTWSRCGSMSFERADFITLSLDSSQHIYVVGGCID